MAIKNEKIVVCGQEVQLEERICEACNRVKFKVMVNSEQRLCSQLCAGVSGFKLTSRTGGQISEAPTEDFSYVEEELVH